MYIVIFMVVPTTPSFIILEFFPLKNNIDCMIHSYISPKMDGGA